VRNDDKIHYQLEAADQRHHLDKSVKDASKRGAVRWVGLVDIITAKFLARSALIQMLLPCPAPYTMLMTVDLDVGEYMSVRAEKIKYGSGKVTTAHVALWAHYAVITFKYAAMVSTTVDLMAREDFMAQEKRMEHFEISGVLGKWDACFRKANGGLTGKSWTDELSSLRRKDVAKEPEMFGNVRSSLRVDEDAEVITRVLSEEEKKSRKAKQEEKNKSFFTDLDLDSNYVEEVELENEVEE